MLPKITLLDAPDVGINSDVDRGLHQATLDKVLEDR